MRQVACQRYRGQVRLNLCNLLRQLRLRCFMGMAPGCSWVCRTAATLRVIRSTLRSGKGTARKEQPVIVVLLMTLFARFIVMTAVMMIPILGVAVTESAEQSGTTYQQGATTPK